MLEGGMCYQYPYAVDNRVNTFTALTGPTLRMNKCPRSAWALLGFFAKAVVQHQVDFLSCIKQDVARAHILAAELPTASGRYLLSHPSPTKFGEVVKWLQVWHVAS